MAENPDITMDRLRTQNREMRLRLEQINLITCYIAEEDTDARQEGLVEIGKLARGEPSSFMRFAEAVSPTQNETCERYKQALQRANGFLIMHNLEPVKLEYPSETARPVIVSRDPPADYCGEPDVPCPPPELM